MPKLYMLIGVPGSGKSTWIANQDWLTDAAIVSSDHFIDREAERLGKTYNDVFKDYVKVATKLMEDYVVIAQSLSRDIVWDQTNTSVKSRKNKLAMLPNYEKIAIVFRTPDAEELTRRLANRPGKSIPENVMRVMISSLVEPTEEEGFKEIWYV